MFRRFVSLVAAAFCAATTAVAQEETDRDSVVVTMGKWVSFTHHDCPPVDPNTPGGTPENPIDLLFFDQAWANAAYSDEPDLGGEPYEFECRWIRLTGFVKWHEYLYPAQLVENALASYQYGAVSYFLENFLPDQPPRGDLAQRRITIVARFYDLCAAAERAEKASGERWRISYPCHEVPAMMLADARVEKIYDATPQYLLGEGNRAVLGSLITATPAQRQEIEPLVRAWAASVRKGVASFADAYLAQYPNLDAEQRQERRADITSRDSYPSHLLRQPRFIQLNLESAPVQVFRPAEEVDFDTAFGCVCLTASCANRWPLTEEDAAAFFGDAACVEINRWGSPDWRW